MQKEIKEMSESLIGLLISRKLTISTAESCTGGMLGTIFTEISGASDAYMGGAITYSNNAKMKIIGVSKETLDSVGAVSKETAMEMASGIKNTLITDIGVSATGIAGPTGGTLQKPVGLVYIGLSAGSVCQYRELRLRGDRHEIREQTCIEIMKMITEYIMAQ